MSDGAQDDGTLSAGAEAFRLGQFAAARDRFAAALAARRRVLGDAHPEVGAILHNLGLALRANGEGGAAEGCHEEALRIFEASLGPADPMAAKSLSALGGLARERGDATAALRFAGRALAVWMRSLQAGDPQIGWALEELGKAHSGAGDDRAALDSWGASLAILLPRFGEGARLAPVLNNCGVAARALGDLAGARNWFGRAVAADAGLAAARHNFAAVLARLGDEAGARREREVALRQTCVFVQRASQPKQGVLIPSLSDAGNVPLEHILPDRDFTRIWWFLAHDSEPVGKKLPPFGVVFNGIGDPDMDEVAGDGAAGKRLRGFMAARPGMRVLNHPDAVSRTRRDRLEQTLAGIAGAVVPRTCRVAGSAAVAELMRAAAQAGIAPPLLLRPAGAHGGHGVVRVESWDDLDEGALRRSDAWYVSRYCDCRGADGFYRKYRMAIVDRVPLPYHLAISRGWMVHYFSAEMEPHDWKLAEEAAFLADPRAVLGAVAITALGEIGARLDLDFCGVDFAMLPDGRVLVFEANATMLIHLESDAGKLAFKNPSVQKIIYAVRTLVAGPKW